MVWLQTLLLALLLAASANAELPRIEWGASKQHLLVPDGVYARMTRLRDGSLLACSQSKKSVIVLRSEDEAKTWSSPVIVTTCPPGVAANPDLCALADGRVLVFWNERPVPDDGPHPFTIRVSRSSDAGKTWQPREEPVFVGGNVFVTACHRAQAANGTPSVCSMTITSSPSPAPRSKANAACGSFVMR